MNRPAQFDLDHEAPADRWWHGLEAVVPNGAAAVSLEDAFASATIPRGTMTSTAHERAAIASHLRNGMQRESGQAVVRVVNARGERCSAVEIVVDDMPFLVESIVSAVRGDGHGVRKTAHPMLEAVRDPDGTLTHLSPRSTGTSTRTTMAESWIRVEIDGPLAEDPRRRLTDRLVAVLADVRTVARDWQRMRSRVVELADQLTAGDAADPDRGTAGDFLRWMADDRFTFLGLDERETPANGRLAGDRTSGLGLLAGEQDRHGDVVDPNAPTIRVDQGDTSVSVHRAAYPEVVRVVLRDAAGAAAREVRILGLFTPAAETESVRRIPLVADRVARLVSATAFRPGSHSARRLLGVLDLFPVGVLLRDDDQDLLDAALGVLDLDERPGCRVFVRRRGAIDSLSCLVFLRREHYSAHVGRVVEELLSKALGGTVVKGAPHASDEWMVRLQVVVHGDGAETPLRVDELALEKSVLAAVRPWAEAVRDEACTLLGEVSAAELVGPWLDGLPATYRAGVNPAVAVDDLRRAEELLRDAASSAAGGRFRHSLVVERCSGDDDCSWRLRLVRTQPASLSELLPHVSDLGVEVIDERPYVLQRDDGGRVWLYDIGLKLPPDPSRGKDATFSATAFKDALAAAWEGATESDALSRLVLTAGISGQEVGLLRAIVQYLRQAGLPYTLDYVAQTMAALPMATSLLVDLFAARMRPVENAESVERASALATVRELLDSAVEAITSRDADRILRSVRSAIEAVLRTNYFKGLPSGAHYPECLVLKFEPAHILDMPAPIPSYEIFVHSPRFEGVHLRFGAVARGGLRWSDRREDYRTEILGLVKAQVVKNSVIVPTGAKGGFVAKRLPDALGDRDAWLAEGRACYAMFVAGLLEVSDNLAFNGEQQIVVPPVDVVRHDGDDPYLVVAADKGTASFSDLANDAARARGFWLGDAFASGGSNGYDHKQMGITARGAWESVRRHFRELGRDPETEPFTAVGIGDMSGDVFGNGMLLSRHVRLIAAFDHRHVFLDPDPDPVDSWKERRRLFGLPRSSWADYRSAMISAGGGIYSRTAKSIPVSEQVRVRLGLPDGTTRLSPDELLRAILLAPVDLLWNGGIGTYVKAGVERHEDAADKANDAIRIDGGQLRARVVAEGGNLGLTQRGRVEAALAGVLLNTDAVDNSAGVDCSDHEVNIKVALDRLVAAGRLDVGERNATLARMTDDVARLVLGNNDAQNRILSIESVYAADSLPVHRRFMDHLVDSGQLVRDLEALPADAECNRRAQDARGLTVPELSVLLAHAKISLVAAVRESDFLEESWSLRLLGQYFPPEMRARFADHLENHPLRRDITTTVLVNRLIDLGGITLAFRAAEESGASLTEVVRAYSAALRVFELESDFAAVASLDGKVATAVQARMWHEHQRLLDRAARWFLNRRTGPVDVDAEVGRYSERVAGLAPVVQSLVRGRDRVYVDNLTEWLVETGVPLAQATRTATQLYAFPLLDITDVADECGREIGVAARAWFILSERYGFDALLTRVSALDRGSRWDVHARAALRDDLYEILRRFTRAVLTGDPDPTAAISKWESVHAHTVERVGQTVRDVLAADRSDVATLSVALRTLRGLMTTTPASNGGQPAAEGSVNS